MTSMLGHLPSTSEVRSLIRSLLRTARRFPDYNIREYIKRRTIEGCKQNRDLSEPDAIGYAFREGKSQLEVASRQAMVYSIYAPNVKSIMEIEPNKSG
ncbi:hypothetical protein SUGI_0466290 [Cryptomeria japonica]|uniref:uncharacterized protein LOC131030159 n=1 Tax=Cryptomeria japonica TaxID=3369 RepID=UPI002408AFD7|nr:uncharacterized protein LOC131030159 [Cryptomeria japonica]GLJ24417.1 hypothetical protein SUGI_0466290 [Cryptomeria japonica]